jgi:hypothetical protein
VGTAGLQPAEGAKKIFNRQARRLPAPQAGCLCHTKIFLRGLADLA